jgi:hypothetical protein
MKELKAEKSRLTCQRDQQKAGLRPLAEKRKQMSIVTRNVTAILGTDTMLVGREHQL